MAGINAGKKLKNVTFDELFHFCSGRTFVHDSRRCRFKVFSENINIKVEKIIYRRPKQLWQIVDELNRRVRVSEKKNFHTRQ